MRTLTALAAFLHSPRFHAIMVGVWAGLAVPTVLWWRDSVFWVAIMSLYANLVGHWSAYQGARAEESNGGGGDTWNVRVSVRVLVKVYPVGVDPRTELG